MKMNRLCCMLIVIVATGTWCPSGEAVPIYEDTSPNGTGAFTALEIGNEVYAAGTAREVTQVQVGLSMQGYSGTSDFVLRLYDNTGLGGAPGALLWQSSVFENVALSGGVKLVSFSVPDILVPDVFTWTLQNSDYAPVAVEYAGAGLPSIGSNPSYSWFGGSGGWTELPNTIFVSRIDARSVPDEANSGLLLCLALGTLALWRKNRSPVQSI